MLLRPKRCRLCRIGHTLKGRINKFGQSRCRVFSKSPFQSSAHDIKVGLFSLRDFPADSSAQIGKLLLYISIV